MFKCSLIFLLTLALCSCAGKKLAGETLIDVQKVCGEPIPLVTKIMKFEQTDFMMQKPLNPHWSWEQVWDMKVSRREIYGLKWMQLRFQHDKLQEVWFGPRKGLEKDLNVVGLNKSHLRDKDNQPPEDFTSGTYYFKDLNNNQVTLEHAGGPQKGTTVTCFQSKKK